MYQPKLPRHFSNVILRIELSYLHRTTSISSSSVLTKSCLLRPLPPLSMLRGNIGALESNRFDGQNYL